MFGGSAKLDFQTHVMAGPPLHLLALLNDFMEHFLCLCEVIDPAATI